LARQKAQSPRQIYQVDEQDHVTELELQEALKGSSPADKPQKPEKREGQEIVIR